MASVVVAPDLERARDGVGGRVRGEPEVAGGRRQVGLVVERLVLLDDAPVHPAGMEVRAPQRRRQPQPRRARARARHAHQCVVEFRGVERRQRELGVFAQRAPRCCRCGEEEDGGAEEE